MTPMNEMLKELGFSGEFIKSFNEYVPSEIEYTPGETVFPVFEAIYDSANIQMCDFVNPDVTDISISGI